MYEKKYKSILYNAPFGYAYHRIITDDSGIPIDYEFLEVNNAFEKITGLIANDILGKTICSIFPDIRSGKFDWVYHYGKLALDGSEFEAEQFSEPLQHWYKVQASSPEKGYFTTIFMDISPQYKLAAIAQTFLTYTNETVDYQYIVDTACQIAGANYGTLNIFDEDGRAFTTIAFSGMSPKTKRIADKLNFNLLNEKWQFDPIRQEKIDAQKTTLFNSLGDLASSALSPPMLNTIAGMFNLGKLAIVKTEKNGRMLGDFTLLFTKKNNLINQAFLETYADITGLLIDRLNHEREYARERLLLEQITDQLTDIVWRTDLQLTTTFISPSVSRIMGYGVEEYLQLPVEKRYRPDQLLLFQSLLHEELENEKIPGYDRHRSRTLEIEQFKPDGTSIPLEIHISFIRDKNDNPIGIQGISRDITERKMLEEGMNQQTRLRELLMTISTDFINVPLENMDETVKLSLEMLGNFVAADRSYIFEYDWQKNVCNNTYEWCKNGIEPEIENLQAVPLDMMTDWVLAHKNREPMLVEDVYHLPHGLAREILEPQGIKSVVSVPMMNRENCIGFVGFDFVKEHRTYSGTELELLMFFAQMLVNIELRKETERQLVIAKERAEESDRLKTSFLANISHEIRTPMNGIIGFLNLLREPNLNDDDRAGYLTIVNQSSDRLLNTINDIIEVSRIESGDISIKKENIELEQLFSYHFEYFQPWANAKNILLKPFQKRTEKPDIYTDYSKLDSILTILLKNAIKFTDRGSIEVGCEQQGNSDFLFWVKDTGKGIQTDKLDIIFRQFMQEDSSLTRSHEGSGLGLTIAKAYVEVLGGTIGVESEYGKGSRFFFTLPAGKPPASGLA